MDTVAFVKDRPNWRIYKTAKALRLTGGYRLASICVDFDEGLFEGIFDDVYFSSPRLRVGKTIARYFNYGWNRILRLGHKNTLRLLKEIGPSLVHCMAEPYDVIRYVMENSKWPVVLDAVDFSGISSGIENLDKRTREDESYCFENADGICHKGPPFEIDYYRQHGYKIDCPELQWMDYCDENLFADTHVRRLSEDDGETHLVYAGNVSVNPKYQYCYFIPLGEQLGKQGIHLHIYPNPYQYRTSHEYTELEHREKHFHFHKPVPVKELSKEIAKYDWGLWIHPVHGKTDIPRMIPAKQRVSVGNKFASYLESGLPVIVSDHLELGKEIIERHGVGFSIKDDDLIHLHEAVQSHNYDELRRNVLRAREQLSLSNQVHRLDEFYGKVISGQ